jgi:hypothetical protein
LALYAKTYGVTVSWLAGEELELLDPRLQMAARELGKLKPSDMEKVFQLLRLLGRGDGS